MKTVKEIKLSDAQIEIFREYFKESMSSSQKLSNRQLVHLALGLAQLFIAQLKKTQEDAKSRIIKPEEHNIIV